MLQEIDRKRRRLHNALGGRVVRFENDTKTVDVVVVREPGELAELRVKRGDYVDAYVNGDETFLVCNADDEQVVYGPFYIQSHSNDMVIKETTAVDGALTVVPFFMHLM